MAFVPHCTSYKCATRIQNTSIEIFEIIVKAQIHQLGYGLIKFNTQSFLFVFMKNHRPYLVPRFKLTKSKRRHGRHRKNCIIQRLSENICVSTFFRSEENIKNIITRLRSFQMSIYKWVSNVCSLYKPMSTLSWHFGSNHGNQIRRILCNSKNTLL